MNSPGCTRRSETEPATGALIDRVGQLLLRQLVGGAAILQAGFEAADGVERRLIVRLRDLEARFGGVAIDLRQQAAPAQLLRALEARCGRRRDWRLPGAPTAICSSAGGCLSCAAIDAELRFDLPQRALGAVQRELQLARLEPDEDVSGAHFGAELHAARRGRCRPPRC